VTRPKVRYWTPRLRDALAYVWRVRRNSLRA
jgi:hypothetical protein